MFSISFYDCSFHFVAKLQTLKGTTLQVIEKELTRQ